MKRNFSVVTSRRHDGFTLEEALAFAKTYRSRGYGANVHTREEAIELFVTEQQDLTRLGKHDA